MHADCFYKTGQTHRVCEDFILNGTAYDGTKFVILADGCSTREMSDVGSRILVLEAMKMIQEYGWEFFSMSDPFLHITRNAMDYMRRVSCSVECLHATLIILGANQTTIRVEAMGDGGYFILPSKFAQKNEFYEPRYLTVSFGDNFPLYPIYLHFMNLGIPESNMLIKQAVGLDSGETQQTEQGWNLRPSIDASFPISEIKFMGIFSDGLESFVDKKGEIIPLKEILTRLNQFKIFRGEFIQRRMKSFLKEMGKEGYIHHDDLSFGGIYIGG